MAVQLIERPAAESQEITFEDYLQMPEIRQRYEIIDGVFTMSPAPTDVHQLDLGEHYEALKEFVRENDLGLVLMAPIDLIIRKFPKLITRQPDVAFFSWESIGSKGTEAFQAARKRGLAPDLAVEILSPDQNKAKLRFKLKDYAEIGIREVWLASREAMTVEVLALRDGEYARAGLYGSGENVVSAVLPGLDVQVDTIFVE